jgi:hypothetical protein
MAELSSKYPSMISHIVYKPKAAPKVEAAIATANADTNTDPQKMINVINTEKKKKPHNITIKNYNPNEPKVYPNMKYTEKQNYRRYKTKTEPKLYSRIMIDEEDDIINTIKKAFGIEKENKRNISNVETSGADYIKDPEPIGVEQTKPPEYITRLAVEDKPPQTPVVRKPTKLSISTEITSAVAAPSPKTPKDLAIETAEKIAKQILREKEALERLNALGELARSEKAKAAGAAASEITEETEEELKTRLFKGLKTEKEKEDAWNKHFRDLRIKEEKDEYDRVTAGLEVGAAGNAWAKHLKDKENERKRLNEEKIDKGNEEYYQIRMNEFKRKKKPTLGEKELTYKDLKSLIDQRFEEKYSSENYKISHPDKVIKNPLYYYNDYGITHLWRVNK